ncbi:hypothetical protein Q0Z83_048090 [Actinoplanes sichuanensis]|uniref:CHAT domain-containing protein n=1 Tax=Actinoplanes sichuanensis TaxID=512349 RepID=A0ABW4AP33_9ACTN|nr:CHAT domain-containing protein [Actinoplanes sichuanensis]BEL06618.1 hypothetical protein Q0Z83_048090 [Actinoplanes sichuanensis]
MFRFWAAAGHPGGVWDTFDGLVVDGESTVHIVHVLGARAVVAYARATLSAVDDESREEADTEPLPDGSLPNAAPVSALDVDFPFYHLTGLSSGDLAVSGRLILRTDEAGRIAVTFAVKDAAASTLIIWNPQGLNRAETVVGSRIVITGRGDDVPDHRVDGRRIRIDEAMLDVDFEPGEHRVSGVLELGADLRVTFVGTLRGRTVQRLREQIARPDAVGRWAPVIGSGGAVTVPSAAGCSSSCAGPRLVVLDSGAAVRLVPGLDLLAGVDRVDGEVAFRAWRRESEPYRLPSMTVDDRESLRFLAQDLAIAGRQAEAAPLMARAAELINEAVEAGTATGPTGTEPDLISLTLLLNHQVRVAFEMRDYPALLTHLRSAVVLRRRLSSDVMVRNLIRPIADTLGQVSGVLEGFTSYIAAAEEHAPDTLTAAFRTLRVALHESLGVLAELIRLSNILVAGPTGADAAAVTALAEGLEQATGTLHALVAAATVGGAEAVAVVPHLVVARDGMIATFAGGVHPQSPVDEIEAAEARFLDAVHRDAGAVPGLAQLLRSQMETGVAINSAAAQIAESKRYLDKADPLAALTSRRGSNRDGAARLSGYVEQWRGRLDQDRDRILAVEHALDFYDALVGLLLDLDAVDEALVAAELARARATADLLGPLDAPTPVPSVEEIRAVVARLGHSVVEYFVRPDELVAWVIRPDGDIRCMRHPVATSTLNDAVADLDRLIEERSSGTADQLTGIETAITGRLAWIAEHVWWPLLPLSAGDAPITVVPHLFLLRVPFAALPDRSGVPLIRQRALTFLPALSPADRLLDRQRPDLRAGGLLALVDPEPMPLPGLNPLTRTRNHVGDVAALFAGSDRDIRIGAEATFEALRRAGPAAGVVLLATHAEAADSLSPAVESYIALAPTATHDGLLRLDDVTGLGLDAPLLVLSACHSGAGRVTGDGVLGMSRAFLVEGASALFLTMYRAEEEAALTMVYRFLELWRHGERTDEAFRTALCDLMTDFAGDSAMSLPFMLYGTGD